MRIPVYNLYIAQSLPGGFKKQFESQRFGNLRVEFVDNYDSAIQNLTQMASLQFSMNSEKGKPIEFDERRMEAQPASDWTQTAYIVRDGEKGEPSVLAGQDIDDGGVWDLCELLTLFTGRRVTTDEHRERHGAAFRYVGRGMEIHFQAMHAAAEAFLHRGKLIEHEMEMALLAHNQAQFADFAQTKMGHLAAALEIVCQHFPRVSNEGSKGTKIPKEATEELIEKVQATVSSCELLDEPQKDSFRRILASRIQQGMSKGFLGKLQDILSDFGAIDADPPKDVIDRIKVVDGIRNAVVHNGRLPGSRDRSIDRETVGEVIRIIVSVIPEISGQAFYRLLIPDASKRAQFKLNSPQLRKYFTGGDSGMRISDLSDLSILNKLFSNGDSESE